MTRIATIGIGLFALLLAAPARAQDPQGPVTQYHLNVVKPGHDAKWEQALQEHIDWHRQQNDTWAFDTYVLLTGERLGQYLTISDGHPWADYDAPSVSAQEDMADAMSKLGPHTESLSSGFLTEQTELSRPPAEPLPSPLIQTVRYRIKPGKNPVFVGTVVRFGRVNDKMDLPHRYFWYSEYGGGAASRTFWRIVGRPNWAAMAPHSPSSFRAVRETDGEDGLQEWIDDFAESVSEVTSNLWQHRPDLSYAP